MFAPEYGVQGPERLSRVVAGIMRYVEMVVELRLQFILET